jgi:putative mRNA 3-end processing factor
MRNKIIRNPCVILSTSGMLNGGPIVWYIKKLFDDENCSLVLSSFQVEGTPGKILLETGKYINEKAGLDLKLKMFVRKLDFSSHLGKSELFEFIEKVNPEKVFCIHGDHTQEFALELKEKGFDAIAPLANNRIFMI